MRPLNLLPAYMAIAPTSSSSPSWTTYLDDTFCLAPRDLPAPGFQDGACSAGTVIFPLGSSGAFEHTTHSVWTYSSPCFRNGTDEEEYCVFTNTDFADNRGISIVTTPKIAESMAQQLPAFHDPSSVRDTNHNHNHHHHKQQQQQQQQQDSLERAPPYRLELIPGKGYGLVATRLIDRGDKILSNTASTLLDYGAFDALGGNQVESLQVAMVNTLPSEHREAFMDLSTHDEIALSFGKKVAKVMSTNAFDVTVDAVEEEPFFYAIFPDVARINHDCRPNTDYHFDPETLTQHVHAIRPIMEGEEITVSYINPLMTRAQRTSKLRRVWGFSCTCSLCSQPAAMAAASDGRIRKMERLSSQLGALISYSAFVESKGDRHDQSTEEQRRLDVATNRKELLSTPQMAELFVSLVEQERAHTLLFEAHSYAAVAWNAVGDENRAVMHASVALEMGLVSVGAFDEEVLDMAELAERPRGHWSFGWFV